MASDGASTHGGRISIVTPSFNQGAFIEECIGSAREQLEPGDEHIVVDGASTDQTLSVLAKYSYLRWVSEPDAGQTDALNKGFRMARGDVIGWLNADDAYLPGALARVKRFFRDHPDVALTYGYVHIVDEKTRLLRKRYSPDFDFDLLVRNGACYAQPTFFFRRAALEQIGYLDPAFQRAMDYDLILTMGRVFRVKKIRAFLGAFRTHAGSMSHSGAADQESERAAASIQAKHRANLRMRYPRQLYWIRDKVILTSYKVYGRLMSLPIQVRRWVSDGGRAA